MQPIIIPIPPTNIAAIQAATNVLTVDVSVSSTPANINQLLRQIQVSGTVTSPPDNGSLTLTTALGNFTLSLSQLPEAVKQQLQQQLDNLFQSQKAITVVIQPGSPPTQAVLLLPSSTPNIESPSTGLQPVVPQPLTITPGSSLPAVVLPRDITIPGANNSSQTPLSNQSGDNLSTTPPALTLQTTDDVLAPAPATTTTPLPSSTPAPILQPGKEVLVQVDAVALPGEDLPEPTGNQISATVIGNGANGQLILKTSDDATLYVRASVEAPVGTSLLVKVEAPRAPPPTVLPQVDSQNFATLQQTLNAVTQINPQLAQQIIESRIPQANGQLTGPLLFFLSALRQGDAKGWLGSEATDNLIRNGKLELLTKLGHAMSESGQTESDPAVGEWKSYPVPLHNHGQFQTLTLHVHEDGRGKSSAGTPGDTPKQVRFLIDVNMSRLGSMQLDGLARPKKLDMIVRSEGPLPPGLPQELRNGYLKTMEALGYTGGLSFQTGRLHWLSPRKDSPQSVVM